MRLQAFVFNSLKTAFVIGLNRLFPAEFRLTLPWEVSLVILPDSFGAVEENLFYSIYFSREELSSADTIIDLGAHIGTFTVNAIINAKRDAKIVAVEPCRRNYAVLLKNMAMFREHIKSKELHVYAINKAVWFRSSRVKLHRSIWSETHNISEKSGGEEVEAVTLDELLDLAEGVTLVKMDIEGAELGVLKEARKLSKVSAISVEAHSNAEEIERALSSNGFTVKIFRYPIGSDLAYLWAEVRPKAYSSLVATYRLITSNLVKPVVTIVKGVKE